MEVPFYCQANNHRNNQVIVKSPVDEKKVSATLMLQTMIRRFLALRSLEYARKYHLSPEIISRVRPFLKAEALNKLPSPQMGKSRDRIRIVKENNLNLLIRIATTKSEKSNLLHRYERMKFGHEIIESINAKYLIIPNATLTKRFLIEKLLPIIKGNQIGTMVYYVQNYQLYDKPVGELTMFFTKTDFKHLINKNNNSMKSVWEHGCPRFDNLATCSSVKDGKINIQIALIDLERLFPLPNKPNHIFKSAKKAILLFPYNFKTIISKCQKLKPFSEEEKNLLNNYKVSAISNFEKIYGRHNAFLERSLQSKINPFTKFLSSLNEKTELLDNLKNRILELHEKTPAFSYLIESRSVNILTGKIMETAKDQSALISLKILGNKPEEVLEKYAKEYYSPSINQFCQFLEKVVDKTDNDPELLKHEIMSLRSLRIKEKKHHHQFELKNGAGFTCKKIDSLSKITVAEFNTIAFPLCDRIIERELKEGEINLAIDRCILDLMKEKRLLAEVYHDKTCSTFFF